MFNKIEQKAVRLLMKVASVGSEPAGPETTRRGFFRKFGGIVSVAAGVIAIGRPLDAFADPWCSYSGCSSCVSNEANGYVCYFDTGPGNMCCPPANNTVFTFYGYCHDLEANEYCTCYTSQSTSGCALSCEGYVSKYGTGGKFSC